MQKIFFTGNITAEPTARATSNGTSVCSFTVAVNRSRKNHDVERESDFFRVTTWRQTADFCSKYMKKGMRVLVVGELIPSTYEGRDGKMRISLDVQADNVEILSEKPAEKKADAFADISTDDLPWGN